MPLRTRLSNTGLKLKIPARSSGSVVASSPYGPSPNRHSASPHRRQREDVFPLPVPRVGTCIGDNSPQQGRDQQVTTVFDASVDSRPVWAVTSTRSRGVVRSTDGFREIPITRTSVQSQHNDLINCDNLGDTQSQSPKLSPVEVDDDDPAFRHRSPLRAHPERQLQRAEILRDWIHALPIGPVQASTSQSNPFFAPRPPHRKKDFNYEPYKYLSSPLPKYNQSPDSPTSSIGTSEGGSILTPTEAIADPLHATRRDSSGVLQSPDVLDPAKEDGFYLLKKDSQRRTTLVKIMKDDKIKICSTWYTLLMKDVSDSCIGVQHLSQLLEGMRSWLPEENVQSLTNTISQLREALDFDGAKINHLQLALYCFQDAVNSVLRKHSIKPHWMFALDTLVRKSVQAATVVLSPELAPHLVEPVLRPASPDPDQDDHDPDDDDLDRMDTERGSTSGVSTSTNCPAGGAPGGGGSQGLVSRLNRVRDDNRLLLNDLLRAQQNYHQLLKQSLEEQKLHLQMLSQNLAASHLHPQTETKMEVSRSSGDQNLVSWLKDLAIDDRSVDVFVNEDLTLNDVLELMSRDDLKRLGLKAGPELRIWRAILRHRGVPATPTTPNP